MHTDGPAFALRLHSPRGQSSRQVIAKGNMTWFNPLSRNVHVGNVHQNQRSRPPTHEKRSRILTFARAYTRAANLGRSLGYNRGARQPPVTEVLTLLIRTGVPRPVPSPGYLWRVRWIGSDLNPLYLCRPLSIIVYRLRRHAGR